MKQSRGMQVSSDLFAMIHSEVTFAVFVDDTKSFLFLRLLESTEIYCQVMTQGEIRLMICSSLR